MQRRQDSAEWIIRNTRRILKDVGPKAAQRFIASRGGPAKWQSAAQEIARHVLRDRGSSTGVTNVLVPLFIKNLNFRIFD